MYIPVSVFDLINVLLLNTVNEVLSNIHITYHSQLIMTDVFNHDVVALIKTIITTTS